MKTWSGAALAACMAMATGQALAEPVPVEAFAASGKLGSPRLSPDGRHLALSIDLGEGNHGLAIHRIEDMRQTALLRLPRYEVPVQVHWVSPKRLVIAKGRQMGSREEPMAMGEIIATDFDGGNQKYVYGYQQSTRTAGLDRGFGYIEGLPEVRDGRFYMRRLSRGTSRSQLYEIDTGKTTSRLIADIPVKDLSFVLDRDGVPRYAYGVDDDDNYLLYGADAQGQNWQPIPHQRLGGRFVPLAFAPDGRQLYALYSVDGGPQMLVRSAADGSAREVLARDAFASIDALEWTPAPTQPFAATFGAGRPQVAYFDPGSEEARLHQELGRSFSDGHVTYVNHSADGQVSLLHAHSDRNPGAWYLFDRAQRRASKLLDRREGIDAARMGERRPFRFRASDGMELDGYLTIPQGAGDPVRLPMVLLPHGGPHAPGDRWGFDNDAQFLASRGYLVLQVNYRGSEGRGHAFERAGYLKWGDRIQDDLLDGVRWSIAQGYADPQRVCAYGASFGAYSAMMAAARSPDLIKCAAGLSGLYDLKMMYSKGDIRTSRYGLNYLARVVGRDDAELAANSPTSLATRIQAPVLLVHGEIDERTPLVQAKAMKAALERAGNAPEWMVVPKEGHGFYKEENNIAFYRRLEAFLARHIGPGSQPR
ncbi:prolyl oligopeptidase family serine peptidase [Pseudoxanthomonas mexicana]|uniref:S9 family peptidase n=1 Tax=Pseudoxanthomonas mexicana TaxID=128785 RepID=UPI00398AF1AE